ncbi:MAG: hypothetical protein EPO07_12900 [Verrucomicrobia bacterium]|nr:MAG: hypothetical protein EPO07_12900 [Verrucomicrobiota bacterium]
MNPLPLLRRGPRPVRSAIPQFNQSAAVVSPAQPELSLEQVRVVRNDFAESDEADLGQAAGEAKATRLLRSPVTRHASQSVELVGRAMDEVSTRLFGDAAG